MASCGTGPTTTGSPVQVQNLSGVTAIATGQNHSLALKTDATLWTWGMNYNGQLADGTTEHCNTPVQVQNPSGTVTVAGGADHTLALTTDGTL